MKINTFLFCLISIFLSGCSNVIDNEVIEIAQFICAANKSTIKEIIPNNQYNNPEVICSNLKKYFISNPQYEEAKKLVSEIK